MSKSKLEATFTAHLAALKITGFEREHHFSRRLVGEGAGIRDRLKNAGLKDWRFDFAWTDLKIAVELNGGTFSGGRHTSGAALHDEYNKLNTATANGWRVFIFDTKHVTSGEAVRLVERVLNETGRQ